MLFGFEPEGKVAGEFADTACLFSSETGHPSCSSVGFSSNADWLWSSYASAGTRPPLAEAEHS